MPTAVLPPVPKSTFAQYPESQTIDNYKRVAYDMLHLNFPLLSELELSSAIDYSISKHFKDTNVKVDNNYKKTSIDMTLLETADYIISREPIITSAGVLFHRHADMPNPVYKMIDGFINDRKVMKKEMFKYPKGSENFEKYNLLQLLLKIVYLSRSRVIYYCNSVNCWDIFKKTISS